MTSPLNANKRTAPQGFTAAELAWLDAQRAKWVPLSEHQAALVRRLIGRGERQESAA